MGLNILILIFIQSFAFSFSHTVACRNICHFHSWSLSAALEYSAGFQASPITWLDFTSQTCYIMTTHAAASLLPIICYCCFLSICFVHQSFLLHFPLLYCHFSDFEEELETNMPWLHKVLGTPGPFFAWSLPGVSFNPVLPSTSPDQPPCLCLTLTRMGGE